MFGYADALVNALLDVEGTRESTVALVALGRTDAESPPAPPAERLDLPTTPLSSAEVTWHALTAMHLASGLPTGADAARWRSRRWDPTPPDPTGPLTELRPLPPDELDARPPEQIIFRRRSTRKYDTEVEIPFAAFSTLLDRSTRGVASDVLVPGAPLTDLYLIVNGVEGLAPGVYLHHPRLGAVELLREGTFRAEADGGGGEVELARVQCAFELCEPVAAVAVAGQDRGQVREVVEVDVRVACVLLIGRDAAGLCAEGAFAEEFDRAETRVVQVDARGQSLHAVHDQVEVGDRHERVGRDAAGRVVQERGERVERDLDVGVVLPGRPAAVDDLLGRPRVQPVGGQRLQSGEGAGR